MTTNLTLISVAEAARRMGLSYAFLHGRVKAGKIPVVRLGARRMVRLAALEALLNAAEQPEVKA